MTEPAFGLGELINKTLTTKTVFVLKMVLNIQLLNT